MLLAIDIGNSLIKFGVFDGETLVTKFSTATDRESTADDLNAGVGERLDFPVTSAIACSVVPPVDASIKAFVIKAFGIDVRFIDSTFDSGLKVDYHPITSLGTDRLVNAFAAVTKYGKPCIVCSLGTATTIDAVNSNGEFIGGIIAPGMQVLAKALHLAAAKLPEVEIRKPDSVIGKSTESSIRSGIFFGYVGLVEGLIGRIAATLPSGATTVATGGFAAAVASVTGAVEMVDDNLTLEGLNLISRRLYTDPEK